MRRSSRRAASALLVLGEHLAQVVRVREAQSPDPIDVTVGSTTQRRRDRVAAVVAQATVKVFVQAVEGALVRGRRVARLGLRKASDR